LIRNHYVGRTFIEPKQAIRHFGVRIKLNPVEDLLRGKRVVLVDDSIVRGTTSRKIVKMVRAAGATEVHMRISCPPTISPCYYGVDTPNKRELIAASHSVEETCKYIEADSLGYLSHEGMLRACGDSDKQPHFCTACYTGNYPVEFPASALVQIGDPVPRKVQLGRVGLSSQPAVRSEILFRPGVLRTPRPTFIGDIALEELTARHASTRFQLSRRGVDIDQANLAKKENQRRGAAHLHSGWSYTKSADWEVVFSQPSANHPIPFWSPAWTESEPN
jgi:hypothetical protein